MTEKLYPRPREWLRFLWSEKIGSPVAGFTVVNVDELI
ncbi:hypothetical protein ACPOL_4284 [Acidisarcina polymorpha]|uniref:Uncharacterized protein n=1 Tax=Acidisarcina polymorpha TaxID=2211140 RepID=A0A2Z5G3B3_9BACT|nr:hypothetical protein ACPOL_4284 [Acidisarcina polymorpha]